MGRSRTTSVFIIGQTGFRQKVMLPVVPGFRCNLFSVSSATKQGPATISGLEESRIKTDDFDGALQKVRGWCDLYTFNITLGGVGFGSVCTQR